VSAEQPTLQQRGDAMDSRHHDVLRQLALAQADDDRRN
jgi:hypothetical protein